MAPYERNPGACDAGASGNNQAWEADNSADFTPSPFWTQRYSGPVPIGQVAADIVAAIALRVQP